MIDFTSVLPFYVSLLLAGLEDYEIIGKTGKIIRLVRIMRVLRLFKLVRHFAGLQSLLHTLKQAYQAGWWGATPLPRSSACSSSWWPWPSSPTPASPTSPRRTSRSYEVSEGSPGRPGQLHRLDRRLLGQERERDEPPLLHVDLHRGLLVTLTQLTWP